MDESFESVLPHFRLSTEYPWAYPWLVDLVAVVSLGTLVVLLAGLLIRRLRFQRQVWANFHATASEHGLSDEQTSLMERIARRAKMRQPLLLLTSVQSYDLRVSAYLKRQPESQTRQAEIDSLGHIRLLLGYDRVPTGQPLRTTRELSTGQRLMVWPVKGGPPGFCHAVVVHRDDDAIVAVPLLREDDDFLAQLQSGDRIKVRFWRRHDTEYRFRTTILEANPDTTAIVIGHSERLERIQKRDFYRLAVRFRLGLIVLPEPGAGGAESIAAGRRLDVSVADISGGGLGVAVNATVAPDATVVVDPGYNGPFPIAGLWCHVAGQEERDGKRFLRLEFTNLSRERQEDLVGVIQRQQIHRVSA